MQEIMSPFYVPSTKTRLTCREHIFLIAEDNTAVALIILRSNGSQ
jgi:hypothetical protein